MTAETKPTTTPPPYLSYKTFSSFLYSLSETGVPHQIDRGVMHKLSGVYQAQMLSAFRFLELIDGPECKSTARLEELAGAFGQDEQRVDALKAFVLPAYDRIVSDVDLTKATYKLIREEFRAYGIDGQVLDRSITFFIRLLTDAKVPFSSHMKPTRQRRGNGSRKTGKTDAADGSKREIDKAAVKSTPSAQDGMIDIPIPLGEAGSFVRIPMRINGQQFKLVQAVFGVIEQMAKQNSEATTD